MDCASDGTKAKGIVAVVKCVVGITVMTETRPSPLNTKSWEIIPSKISFANWAENHIQLPL